MGFLVSILWLRIDAHGVWVAQSFALVRSFGRRKRKVMLLRRGTAVEARWANDLVVKLKWRDWSVT